MADKKISQLPVATTPLAGTEVLPIVQSGTTDQVSVANLTAGRAISATQYTSTIATGTAPLVVASTTEVANLKAATATLADSATSANAVKSNATTGLLQVTGPAAGATRVMTTPDANFTVARTDVGQTFNGNQTINSGAQFPLQLTSPSGYRCIQTFSDGTYTARVGVYPPEASIYVGAQSNHPVSVIVNGTVRSTFDTSGNQSITNGNLVIGTSGKGIDFSAVTNAGSTNEVLSNYAEGLYTPTLTGASSNPTVTYTNQLAAYTRVGNLVYFNVFIKINTISGGSGNACVSLPFTVKDFGNALNFAQIPITITGQSALFGSVINNGTTVDLNFAVTSLAGGNEIRVSGCYQAA